jgi:hypothetical protein
MIVPHPEPVAVNLASLSVAIPRRQTMPALSLYAQRALQSQKDDAHLIKLGNVIIAGKAFLLAGERSC